MVLWVKKNECILDISLDKYIFLLEVVTVNNLQSIHDVLLSSRIDTITLSSVSGVYIHIYKSVGL